MDKEGQCLKKLKHRIKENKDLDDFYSFLNDKFLLHFVRGRKYDSDKAYKTLLGYINVRRGKHKDWFQSIRPSNFRRIGINPMRVLKDRDHLHRLVVIINMGLWDPREYPMDEALKLAMLSVDEFMEYEDAEKNGVVAVYDCEQYSFQHARAITPTAISKCLQMCFNNFPLGYKAVHIVNEMYLFTLLFKAVKHVLPKKLKERIHFHSTNLELLHESLSPEILPESLGGTLTDEEAFDEKFSERIFNKDIYYERFSNLILLNDEAIFITDLGCFDLMSDAKLHTANDVSSGIP